MGLPDSPAMTDSHSPERPEVPTDPAARRRLVNSYAWHHQITLPGGITTPGQDKSARKLSALRLPSLVGKSVLDVGAWDGYFSFAAERLGAQRTVALDSYVWENASVHPDGQNPFRLAHSLLESRVEDVHMEVLEIAPDTVGEFDVVFFLGVLYHMRDPMMALEAVASVTRELLVVESLVDLVFHRRMAMAFYPGTYLGGVDRTNWWAPNPKTLVEMVREFGFREVTIIDPPGLGRRLYTTARNAGIWLVHRLSPSRNNLPLSYITMDRCIIHARR